MSEIQPPKWATRFLRWFVTEELIEEIQGDLEEAYVSRRKNRSKLRADLWYISDVVKFFKPYSFEKYSGVKQFVPMFNNYLKVSFRNILKRRSFTAINMLGLSIGISAVMLVGLYVHHELTFDEQFPGADRTFRLVKNYRDQSYACMSFPNYYSSDASVQLRLLDYLRSKDGVDAACHFVPNMTAIGPASKRYLSVDGREFVREDFLFTNTGKAFQEIFPQEFLIGNAASAYSQFQTVVLTESVANAFYGDNWRYFDLLSKEIRISDEVFSVGGVVKDLPGNVHFDFGMIVHQAQIPSWGAYTYFRTKANGDEEAILSQLNQEVDKVYPGYKADVLNKGIGLLPLQKIHFTEGLLYEIKPLANLQYLLIFGVVGLVILVIIWTNYANLSVATYAGRQKELGVRKVMGARGRDVSYQVLVEAILITLLCFPFVLGLVYLLLPYVNQLLGVAISPVVVFDPNLLLAFLSVLILTGIISGAYPAIAYGRKPLLRLFNGKVNVQSKFGRFFHFRRILLTTQFLLIISLMSLAMIILQQMKFINEKSLGFDTEGVVFFPVDGPEKYHQIQAAIEQMPEVVSVGNGIVPGAEMYNQLTYKMRGEDETLSDGTHLYTSLGSMEVLGIRSMAFELLEGNQDSVFLINETAARKLAISKGVEVNELIGETLVMEPEWENETFGNGTHYTIAGIIEDFDYFSLKYPSQSLLLEVHTDPEWVYNMLIKINTTNWVEMISEIENAYLKVEEERPFDLTFLDRFIFDRYEKERNAGNLVSGLTLVCMILSVMGLVGIVGFITQLRQKEMGIRKVFGASIAQILSYISREYLVMILVATSVAVPVSIYLANRWLDSFAYRIVPSSWMVILSGLVTMVIVVLVVVIQSYQRATMNPSDTLRYE